MDGGFSIDRFDRGLVKRVSCERCWSGGHGAQLRLVKVFSIDVSVRL